MQDRQVKPGSTFLSILNTWPEYYETMDEGLGTTYERFILHRYFENLKAKHQIESIVEAPSFGMTGISGINSLWWAGQGIKPVIVDNDEVRIQMSEKVWQQIPLPVKFQFCADIHSLPFDNQSFDLSWNFASLWFVERLNDFLGELNRITKKVIFICVPNRNGVGYRLRDMFNKENIPGFFPDNIKHKKIISGLKKYGWNIARSGYLDIPPWPDIAMKKEDMLKKAGLGFLVKEKTAEQDSDNRTCIVDYFMGDKPGLEQEILKYSFLEKAPFPVKQLWGHHRYFIFIR